MTRRESHWGFTRKVLFVPRRDGLGYTKRIVWVPWSKGTMLAANVTVLVGVLIVFVSVLVAAVSK